MSYDWFANVLIHTNHVQVKD